jgi:predicted DNA-binding transcriptional regulator AlpA
MELNSTVQAAKKLGLSMMTMHRYMKAKKIPVPEMRRIAGVRVRVWTDGDIERVRKLLPKIANGRKTRYQKLKEKKNKAQARVPVPHKAKKKK